MVLPKSKKEVGLGRAIINKRAKDARTTQESQRYTTDVSNGHSSRMQSVTQETPLDEFLSTAQLAEQDFTAEKQNVRLIHAPTSASSVDRNPFLLSSEEEKDALRKHWEHRTQLRVPRRPPWKKSMTSTQLDRQEKEAFLDWRRSLAQLQEKEGLLMTPFERNLEVWRQLWRVLEKSHLIVQIVDARNPLKFRCQDLESYVDAVEGAEGEQGTGKGLRKSLLLINKSDLLDTEQRRRWAEYFDANGIRYAFFSALDAKVLQEAKRMAEEARKSGQSLTISQAREWIWRGGKLEDDDEDVNTSEKPNGTAIEELEGGVETPRLDNGEANANESGTRQDPRPVQPLHEDEEPRTRILTVLELEELFVKCAPDLSRFADHTNGTLPPKLVVGLVGYPNVGKSSTINALLDSKVVSVSSTPGKTKHFQTIHLSPSIMLCDCPGLVFPQFATTNAELICDGVLPIDQMREHTAPCALLCQRIIPEVLELTYGLRIRRRTEEEGGDGQAIVESDLLSAYAIARGFARAGVGNPDEARAARYILKDYISGKLLYCHPPPGISDEEFNRKMREETVKRLEASGKKMAPVTRVSKGAATSIQAPVSPTSQRASNSGSMPTESAKTRALDRDFFENQALAFRPVVQGTARNGMQVSRNMRLPHQNAIADDGTSIDAKQAQIQAVLNAAGGKPDKRHFKPRRTKLRTGNPAVGYD